MCHKKQSADIYEQWGRSIKLVNGSHTISMIDKFPSQSHLWNTASTPRKKVISVPNCDWWRKGDLFWKPEVEKIVAVPRWTGSSTRRPNRFGKKPCIVWWDQRCPVKVLIHNAIIDKWSIWIMHWSKSDRNGPKDMAKWFCYTSVLRLIYQNWWKTPWNCLHGRSFRTYSTPLTWRHLTITSLHQWDTCLQSSTSAFLKELENGSKNCLPQKKKLFFGKVFITYLKDGQSV
jgi:hypothetical protein